MPPKIRTSDPEFATLFSLSQSNCGQHRLPLYFSRLSQVTKTRFLACLQTQYISTLFTTIPKHYTLANHHNPLKTRPFKNNYQLNNASLNIYSILYTIQSKQSKHHYASRIRYASASYEKRRDQIDRIINHRSQSQAFVHSTSRALALLFSLFSLPATPPFTRPRLPFQARPRLPRTPTSNLSLLNFAFRKTFSISDNWSPRHSQPLRSTILTSKLLAFPSLVLIQSWVARSSNPQPTLPSYHPFTLTLMVRQIRIKKSPQ